MAHPVIIHPQKHPFTNVKILNIKKFPHHLLYAIHIRRSARVCGVWH